MKALSYSSSAADLFKRSHPVLQAFHSGLWGWRRVQGALDLTACVHRTKRIAEIDRARAALAEAESDR
jgi:hypothetical protein